MEVKKAGRYKTRGGREVEIYGFDDLGTGETFAEGFIVDNRSMCHWYPETGKAKPFGKDEDTSLDIISHSSET